MFYDKLRRRQQELPLNHTQVMRHQSMCKLQAQGANGAKLRYTGMTDVLRKTVQADGLKGLYRVSFMDLLSHAFHANNETIGMHS